MKIICLESQFLPALCNSLRSKVKESLRNSVELIDKSTYRRMITTDWDLTGGKEVIKKHIKNSRNKMHTICLGFNHNYDDDKYMRLYRHGTMWLKN